MKSKHCVLCVELLIGKYVENTSHIFEKLNI